ncbi:MAG: type II toxin-antitoxin system HicB family antitoxin [Devosia sp.]
MHYVAKFVPDGEGFLVTFSSIPEAVTGGASKNEALENAGDALEVALLTYASDGRPLPTESVRPQSGGSYFRIPVSATVTAKLAFIAAFKSSGLTRVALATRLGKAEGEIRRMLDPYHRTKLASLEAGLRALGKRLVVTVEEAA